MAFKAAIRTVASALLLIFLISVNNAAGQTAPEIGEAWQAAAAFDAARTGRGMTVNVRFDVLRRAAETPGVVTLPLTNGTTVRFEVQWSRANANQVSVAGPLLDAEGEASLTVVGDALAGRIVVGDRLFLVRRLGGAAAHLVSEQDQASLPPEAAPRVRPVTRAPAADVAVTAGDSNAFVDLMILYTPAARAAIGGTSAMIAELTGALNNANLALANAGVIHRFRLAHHAEVAYAETGQMGVTLEDLTFTGDGQLESVHALRDQHRADVVSLFSTDADACGIGWLMGPSEVNASAAPWAFNVVNWTCANANLSMAHEIGHNMGIHHDRQNAGGSPAFPYAYGYRVNGVARDVMAYDAGCVNGCPRRPIYSTPLFNFPGTGVTAGTATEDNARALNGTSTAVANFRQSACTVTISATSASLSRAGGSRSVTVNGGASCAWAAASNNPAFVTITSGTSGAGAGVVTYLVAPNNGLVARTATLAIAGQTLTIFQAGANNTGDLDGDGRAELTVYRAFGGLWYLLKSSSGFTAGDGYVSGGNTPVAGDFDGDGRQDIAMYRHLSPQWFVLKSSTNFTTSVTYQWGISGDTPVPADYDGDGQTDIAVYRRPSGTWYVLLSASGYTTGMAHNWGADRDVPVPGDFDGDDRADIAVYRPSTGHWFIRTSGSEYASWMTYQWGTPDDVAVPADYDGDARTDIAVYRTSTGTWYILTSASNFTAGLGYAWGGFGDAPVPADYDGDGRTDLAVYRSSIAHWFILTSTSNFTASLIYQWGAMGDTPILRRW